MVKFAALFGLVCVASMAMASSGVVRDEVFTALSMDKSGTTDVVIEFKEGVSRAYTSIEGKTFPDVRGAKMTVLREALMKNAAQAQKTVRMFLAQEKVDSKVFWISNSIIAKGVSKNQLQKLASDPNVSSIRSPVVIPLEGTVSDRRDIAPEQGTVQWGIQKINADELWAQGFDGTGIVLSSVDTGVRGTHRILRDNFLGAYGWFDPSGRSAAPRDGNGHGTHTMGTIAGSEGYGVAPGAKWMSCMGCSGNSCFEEDLLSCGEFIACPTDTQGANSDCSKAPHVVSNSWGSTLGGQNWYDAVIRGWHAANVIVVFSAGNSGPFCSTVGSPGDRDVIGVGATDVDDGLAFFSSVGPATDGTLKPEISAPGDSILSSYNTGDEAFATLSGTSMACPHVAGSIGLLKQKVPTLTYAQARDAVFSSAETKGLAGFNQNCGGINEGVFPNQAFGYGRLDVAAAAM